MDPHRLGERIESAEAIDQLAEPVHGALGKVLPRGALKDVLHGVWLGHPLHPLLTDLPIGFWTSAFVLDLCGKRMRPAADTLVGLGVLSALPTAASGAADWSELNKPERRAGLVHGLANAAATVLLRALIPGAASRSEGEGRVAGYGRIGGGDRRRVPGRASIVPARRRRQHQRPARGTGRVDRRRRRRCARRRRHPTAQRTPSARRAATSADRCAKARSTATASPARGTRASSASTTAASSTAPPPHPNPPSTSAPPTARPNSAAPPTPV